MAERFIPLEGGRNLRDLGGWTTAEGGTVRWGQVYRAGSLGGLTPAGRATLESLGLGAIVDLRSVVERAGDDWAGLAALPGYWARDYGNSRGDLRERLAMSPVEGAGQGRAMMLRIYARLPFEQAESYALLFQRLLSARQPVLFKCSAGKDRTGIGAALILSALGVPFEQVVADYLLTRGAPGMETLVPSLSGLLPKAELAAVLGVEPAYLEAALAAITAECGSLEGYLARLGLGPAETAALRAALVE